MNGLSIDKINIGYRGNSLVVSDFSLEVKRGTAKIIVGNIGSGKSSILRAIAGLVDYCGEIKYNGTDIKEIKIKDRNFVYASFDSPLFLSKTVRYNLAYGLRLRKLDNSKVESSIEEVSCHFGISELLDIKVSKLPSYVRHNIVLARAFARDADVYLINDPTRGLDETDAKIAIEKIFKIFSVKKSIMIFATSDYSLVRNLDCEIVLLKDGKSICQASANELNNSPPNIFTALFTTNKLINICPCSVLDNKLVFVYGDRELDINLGDYSQTYLKQNGHYDSKKDLLLGLELYDSAKSAITDVGISAIDVPIKRLLIFEKATQELLAIYENMPSHYE